MKKKKPYQSKSVDAAPVVAVEKPVNRLRQSYRAIAERLNPNPAVQVYDSYGRPREKSNNHQWLGQR